MRRKKRRNPVAPWLAAIAVLGLALWLLLSNAVFVVRDVTIEGAGEVPESDVRHLCGIQLGTRMRAVDEAKVRSGVESDGRVAFVSLEKRYPSRVVLTVRPRTIDALILQGGKILALDAQAYVVQVAERLPDRHVPYVSGIKASYYALGRQLDLADGRCPAMTAVLEALKAQNATAYVSELSVAKTDDLRIITRTGMTVLLGDAENMEAKIAWMAGALADLEARGETEGELDVSSGTKADYRPGESPAVEAPSVQPTQAPVEATAPEPATGAEQPLPLDPEAAEIPVS